MRLLLLRVGQLLQLQLLLHQLIVLLLQSSRKLLLEPLCEDRLLLGEGARINEGRSAVDRHDRRAVQRRARRDVGNGGVSRSHGR